MIRTNTRRAFSLIELLVLIGIISILLALLLAAVQRAREAAQRSACGNNLRQIGLALQSYHHFYKHYPMGAWNGSAWCNPYSTGSPRGGTWLIEILPYIEEIDLYRAMITDKTAADSTGSNNPINAAALARRGAISTLICPASPCPQVTTTVQANVNAGMVGICIPSYAGVSGADMGYLSGTQLKFKTNDPNTTFSAAMGAVSINGVLMTCMTVDMRQIVDGTSNTICVAEQSDWGKWKGNLVDIRSSNTVGGFLGTGSGGYLLDKQTHTLTFAPTGLANDDRLYETSGALTTVRWPLNFKSIPTVVPGDQWNFHPKALPPGQKGDWKACNDGQQGPQWPATYSGLFSYEYASKKGKKGHLPTWNIGANTPIQSVHPGGAMVLFADGHVVFLTDGAAGTALAGRGSVLERLCVRDDNEAVTVPN
jgi:prepilin-type processing-associated H-X9-DG protein